VRQEKKTEGDQDPREKEGVCGHMFEILKFAHTVLVDPYPADVFKAGQKELAQDLIIKEQQIEALISMLPGLDNSEKDQQDTIRQLEDELMAAEQKRKQALKEKEAVLARLESVIRSVKRP
jgi:mediator of RNA polymerase II transcription subunit 21